MAHCVYSGEEEVERMKKRGVFIAHCPESNTNLSSGVAPVRRYLEEGLCVGLGSDVAGGTTENLFAAMAQAIQASKLRWRLLDDSLKPLTAEEVFFMASKGGGAFFGKAGSFEPDYVIPFQIDRKKAEEIFGQWIRRKRFVPDSFYSPKQIQTMTGVYFPYWLYRCQLHGNLTAEGRNNRVWTAGNIRYTETKVYDVRREGDLDIDSVARNALKKANRKLADGVLPYRMEEKKPFSMGYLSGFVAENRDMERESFVSEVQSEVRQFALENLKASAGDFSSLEVKNSEVDVTEEGWNYALLPVWTLTYNDKARGKIYYFALNGQTGKVWGELPVDNKKLAVLFLGVVLPLLILLLTGGYFLG